MSTVRERLKQMEVMYNRSTTHRRLMNRIKDILSGNLTYVDIDAYNNEHASEVEDRVSKPSADDYATAYIAKLFQNGGMNNETKQLVNDCTDRLERKGVQVVKHASTNKAKDKLNEPLLYKIGPNNYVLAATTKSGNKHILNTPVHYTTLGIIAKQCRYTIATNQVIVSMTAKSDDDISDILGTQMLSLCEFRTRISNNKLILDIKCLDSIKTFELMRLPEDRVPYKDLALDTIKAIIMYEIKSNYVSNWELRLEEDELGDDYKQVQECSNISALEAFCKAYYKAAQTMTDVTCYEVSNTGDKRCRLRVCTDFGELWLNIDGRRVDIDEILGQAPSSKQETPEIKDEVDVANSMVARWMRSYVVNMMKRVYCDVQHSKLIYRNSIWEVYAMAGEKTGFRVIKDRNRNMRADIQWFPDGNLRIVDKADGLEIKKTIIDKIETIQRMVNKEIMK